MLELPHLFCDEPWSSVGLAMWSQISFSGKLIFKPVCNLAIWMKPKLDHTSLHTEPIWGAIDKIRLFQI